MPGSTCRDLGFGVSVDRADWPLQGTVLFDWGAGYQIGVLKDDPQGVNVDLPQLTTDSLRFALAVQGRPDTRIPDQVFRPSFAVHWTSSSTQAYDPTAGTNNPLSHGSQANDSSWTVRRTGLVLGMEWSWLERIHAQIEGELVLEGITAKQGALHARCLRRHELLHHRLPHRVRRRAGSTLIPAWREAIPKEDGFCLRLGMQYQVLGGPGPGAGLVHRPERRTRTSLLRYPNAPLGPHACQAGGHRTLPWARHCARAVLDRWAWEDGSWTRSCRPTFAFSWNTWTPSSRTAESGRGWDVQLRYSM
jgi:hypothetical protein